MFGVDGLTRQGRRGGGAKFLAKYGGIWLQSYMLYRLPGKSIQRYINQPFSAEMILAVVNRTYIDSFDFDLNYAYVVGFRP